MPRIRPLRVSVQRIIGSSGEVASGRISGDRADGAVRGRLATAAAAWGRCHWLWMADRIALDGCLARLLSDRFIGTALYWLRALPGRSLARCRLAGDCDQAG